jgi:hypothetical protein
VFVDLKAASYRSTGPADMSRHLVEALRAGGVETVPELSQADATAWMRFEEKKGREYSSLFVGGDSRGHGTVMHLTVELKDKKGRLLGRWSAEGETPMVASGELDLYSEAKQDLLESGAFRRLGSFVAGALSNRAALSRLSPLLADPKAAPQTAALLAARKFIPATDEERALLALSQRRYPACVKLGEAAVGPLLENLRRLRGGAGAEIEGVALALEQIGSPLAETPLIGALGTLSTKAAGGPMSAEATAALVRALGRCGSERGLARIGPLVSDPRKPVAAAARAAVPVLVMRLQGPSPLPQLAGKAKRRVAVRAFVSAWREGHFDIEKAIREQVESAGAVAVPSGEGGADALVVVEYSEEMGRVYETVKEEITPTRWSFRDTGTPSGRGTLIRCEVTVADLRNARVIGPKSIAAETPYSLPPGVDLHLAAIDELKEARGIQDLPGFLAAALGIRR